MSDSAQHMPDGCTELVRLTFACPEYGPEDYQSTLTVNADEFPVYRAAPALLAALEAAEGALQSFIDGNTSPDLRACAAIADMARTVLAQARP